MRVRFRRRSIFTGLVSFLAALFVSPSSANALDDPVFCPAGEITLHSGRFTATLKGPGRDVVSTRKSYFVVPAGAAIDPANEAFTYYVEADRQPLYSVELEAGALRANSRGTAFQFKQKSEGGDVGKGSRVKLRVSGVRFKPSAKLSGLDLADLNLATPPVRIKQVLKIGEDCLSSVLLCSVKGAKLDCRPERVAALKGKVKATDGTPLSGVMLTAYDDSRLESITVFSQANGGYEFPKLRTGTYRLRSRVIGYEDDWRDPLTLAGPSGAKVNFTLTPTSDTNDQLPATYFSSLLLPNWSSPTVRGDFTLSCGNCHQIGDWRFRRDKTLPQWESIVNLMVTYLPPFFPETRDTILDVILETYGPAAPPPPIFDPPPPPSGDVLRAVIYEYGLGDETTRPSCHDLELGLDGIVYADDGVRWIDPRTGERGVFPLNGGAHSIERDADGNMWITQAGADTLAFLDVRTGAFRYFPLPVVDGDQGSYPHTLRFDDLGRIWFSTTKSNHLTRFDPATEQFTYYPLPPADPAEVGLSIPTAYGCDVAPDGTIWYSQLHGQRIGRFDPDSEELKDWRPPFYGPRRLHVDADGILWVPGYGSGVLGRFDPAIERWKVYDLPTGIAGPPGYGGSETPYALNTNRMNGEVWVTGSNSDTLIRFDIETEEFTAFPLPSTVSYTREVEFDADNSIWTCTSNAPPGPGELGRGKFVKIELRPLETICGDGRLDPGEDCDDGNGDDCDSCTSRCTLVTGCGDGVVCASEECDDGDADDCDGCSSLCVTEPGLLCGDSIVSSVCGEECDPPESEVCASDCTFPAFCGDGVVDDGEDCDDGNGDDCDTCSTSCTVVTGCGDGVVCGSEQCDDGNLSDCDGCLPSCALETGHICGDGIVKSACGEECDPPSDGAPICSYLCQSGPADPLGTRHISIGGPVYSSALGTGLALGALEGDFDIAGGTPAADGITTLAVSDPFYYRAAILGGSFGYMCFKISSCTGTVDCNGGTAVDVEVVQDSAGPGTQGNPPLTTTGLGTDGGPGSVLLTCSQAFYQIPGGQGDDCLVQVYPPETPVAYTTGHTEGYFIDGDPKVGSGMIEISGENFVCSQWTQENGPGALAGTFLLENDPQAGDTANVAVIDD